MLKKQNIPITVMGDGRDAVLILHGILDEEGMLENLYSRVGAIADAALYGIVQAEPVTRNVTINTDNEKFTEGEFAGMTPKEVTERDGDKGYIAIAALEDSVSPNLSLAIHRELYRYIKWRFSKIQDPASYAGKLTEGQLNLFLARYEPSVTEKIKENITKTLEVEHYEDLRDYGSIAKKKLMVEMIIKAYQDEEAEEKS